MFYHVTLSLGTIKNLCPNLQKPPKPKNSCQRACQREDEIESLTAITLKYMLSEWLKRVSYFSCWILNIN